MLQPAGKFLFVAVLVFLGFSGGCGDLTERMYYPGELSDNDLRWFCLEGRVTAELMRGRGFHAQDGANGRGAGPTGSPSAWQTTFRNSFWQVFPPTCCSGGGRGTVIFLLREQRP
jgi:hypothetical protein